METYKQSVKDKSRRGIWTHAVESLTSKRSESRILGEAYLTSLSNCKHPTAISAFSELLLTFVS